MTDKEIPLAERLCGCGRRIRYSHGGDKSSCNKYAVCLTYDEMEKKLKKYMRVSERFRATISKIVDEDAKSFQYKSWAVDALADANKIDDGD